MKFSKNYINASIIILGVLLIFVSFSYFNSTSGAMIALGVISMLIGIAYILIFALTNIKSGKQERIFSNLFQIVSICGIPVFYFVYSIATISLFGTNNVSAVGWILNILLLISTISLTVIQILFVVNKTHKLNVARNILVSIFAAVHILQLVFSLTGSLNPIGSITLFDICVFICYAIVVAQPLAEFTALTNSNN